MADQLIQKNKQPGIASSGRSTVRGRGGGGGRISRSRGRASGADYSATIPARHVPNDVQSRATPDFTQGFNQIQMQDLLMPIPGGSDGESGTKLYISNLDNEVTDEDIKVIFSEVGELRRYSIHYDKSGRSKGTAEVAFARQSDAFAAVNRYNNVQLDGKPMKIRYNNVQLDGKPMKIEMVGVKLVTPPNIAMPPTSHNFSGNAGGGFQRQQRVAGRGRDRGGGDDVTHSGKRKRNATSPRMTETMKDPDYIKYMKMLGCTQINI